jgi:imidazolonepropionase-like amidohydrolase
MVNLVGEVGVVAPGKLADIVIWDRDPIAAITALQCPAEEALIIKDGRIVDTEGGGFRQLSEEPPRARMFFAG